MNIFADTSKVIIDTIIGTTSTAKKSESHIYFTISGREKNENVSVKWIDKTSLYLSMRAASSIEGPYGSGLH